MPSAALISARLLAPVVRERAEADRDERRVAWAAAVAADEPRATLRALRADLQLAHGAVRSLSTVDRLVHDIT